MSAYQVVKVIEEKPTPTSSLGTIRVVTPNNANNELVVLVCKMSNGLKNTATIEYPGGDTAITDSQGQSYSPRLGLSADIASRGQDLLPGAAFSFAPNLRSPRHRRNRRSRLPSKHGRLQHQRLRKKEIPNLFETVS